MAKHDDASASAQPQVMPACPATKGPDDMLYQTEFPKDHPPILEEKIGVLLLNLGTPEATDYWSMRRYLKEFLSDKRVIETNPLIWKPLLNLVILTKRPKSSGEAYEQIWNREKDESPLKTVTRAQAEGVARILKARYGDHIEVDWAMRYGFPSTDAGIRRLKDMNCNRILLAPLYPQYSAATTGTANDHAFRTLMQMRWQPAIRTLPPYHDHPQYIEALARSIEQHLARQDWEPEVILSSFHGLPQSYLDKGDPYHCQCAKTSRLLRDRLGWPAERFRLTFQSRFGNEVWLQPYTDETIEALAKAGVKRLTIVAPGFSADCVETLEELAIQGREAFEEHGGEKFSVVPCLNDSPDSIEMIADLCARELQGWVEEAGRAEMGSTAPAVAQ